MVIDHSTDQPMKVWTWNDLVGEKSESIVSNNDSFKVIGITTLRPITRQGFSLKSTMSTFFLKDPQGDKAEALAEWNSFEEFSFLNIENLASTLPQEVFWLNVVTTDIEFERLRAYIGCSHCGKQTDLALGTVYSCKSCSRKDIHVAFMKNITFNVSNGTGSLELTIFTNVCDKLFRMPIQEIYEMKTMGVYMLVEPIAATTEQDSSSNVVSSSESKKVVIDTSTKIAEDTVAKIVTDSSMESDQASLGAKEGKAIGSEELVNSEFKLRKVKQERVTRRRTLIFQDDDQEDSYNHATTLTKDQVSSSFNKY
uniref:Replication factor A C-terminal domain-containing protein n=1 Tax=Chenopodium quinoa TaxID=63459 RepID=A0A803N614_CHEQI